MNLVLFAFEQNAERLNSWPFEKLQSILYRFLYRKIACMPQKLQK